MTPEQILARLDEDQRAFCELPPTKWRFLNAGAGSGKTRTIVHKIAHLVATGAAPNTIVAVSFTKKSATELQSRLAGLLSAQAASEVIASTFHSLCLRILKAKNAIGPFQVLEPRQAVGIMGGLMKEVASLSWATKELGAPKILAGIGLAKSQMWRPEDVPEGGFAHIPGECRADFVTLYGLYDRKLELAGKIDFDGMLYRLKLAMDEHPGLERGIRAQVQWMFVDEFQDLTPLQRHISERICGGTLVGVGHLLQSIYGWRGADYDGNAAWAANADCHFLMRNYRSTSTLVHRMNAMAAAHHPVDELSRDMQPMGGPGAEPILLPCPTQALEADAIAAQIERLIAGGETPGEIGVIYRLNALGGPVESALLKRKIPYRVVGGRSFYDLAAVKDAIAYLTLAEEDDDDALARVYNEPRRFLGKAFWDGYRAARQRGASMLEAIVDAGARGQGPVSLCADLRALRRLAGRKPSDILEAVYRLRGTGRDAPLFTGEDGSDDPDEDRMATLESLAEIAAGFDCVADIIAVSASSQRSSDDEDSTDKVWLMSGHRAKGLEFNHVFSPGWTNRVYPFWRCEVEDELRVAYVIGTRARHTLTLSWPVMARMRPTQPSRFLWPDLLAGAEGGYLDEQYPKRTAQAPAMVTNADATIESAINRYRREGGMPVGLRSDVLGTRVPGEDYMLDAPGLGWENGE